MLWEYEYVQLGTNELDDAKHVLNGLGSIGWELCGWASADRTLGLNKLIAIMKRPVAGFPPPADVRASWHSDPAGRFEQRYWDGLRWTQFVSRAGARDVDPPLVSYGA